MRVMQQLSRTPNAGESAKLFRQRIIQIECAHSVLI